MKRFTPLLVLVLITLAGALPVAAAPQVATLEVKGLVCQS